MHTEQDIHQTVTFTVRPTANVRERARGSHRCGFISRAPVSSAGVECWSSTARQQNARLQDCVRLPGVGIATCATPVSNRAPAGPGGRYFRAAACVGWSCSTSERQYVRRAGSGRHGYGGALDRSRARYSTRFGRTHVRKSSCRPTCNHEQQNVRAHIRTHDSSSGGRLRHPAVSH